MKRKAPSSLSYSVGRRLDFTGRRFIPAPLCNVGDTANQFSQHFLFSISLIDIVLGPATILTLEHNIFNLSSSQFTQFMSPTELCKQKKTWYIRRNPTKSRMRTHNYYGYGNMSTHMSMIYDFWRWIRWIHHLTSSKFDGFPKAQKSSKIPTETDDGICDNVMSSFIGTFDEY